MDEYYDRAVVREQTIWPSFVHGLADINIESTKIVIFGLYANSYLLGHNYLKDITDEELQRLVDVYDSSIAELGVEEQNLVLEIAAKKYLKTIEIQIKDNKLTTKTQQFNAAEEEYNAKIAAFAVDLAALETKREKVQLEIDRAELKNKTLASKIQIEVLAQSYVAVEIAEKQLGESKARLKASRAQLRGLEIQLDITNVGLQMIDVEASKSQIDVDIANYNARTAGINLVYNRLEVAIAEAQAVNNEKAVYLARATQIAEKGSIVTAETIAIKDLIAKEPLLGTAQSAVNTGNADTKIAGYKEREVRSTANTAKAAAKNNADIEISRQYKQMLEDVARSKGQIFTSRSSSASSKASAAIAATMKLAKAKITTELRHQIGGA